MLQGYNVTVEVSIVSAIHSLTTIYLNCSFIPGFLLKVIVLRSGRRHLLFGTRQLQIPGAAKRWYVDGTFKVVRSHFYHFLTVHWFVRKDECIKSQWLML